MSVALAEPVAYRPDTAARAAQPGRPAAAPGPLRAPVRTRPGRTGPGVGPVARPRRVRFSGPPAVRPQGCAPAPAPQVIARPAPARGWHLTERGLAVVLVLAAALVAASVVVVGLTAVRVTSEGYHHPSHSAAAPVLAQP